MIPKNINKNHILLAIQEIDRNGIPPDRISKKYYVVYNEKKYPPKYVLSLANKYSNGRELDPSTYSGGVESNDYLVRLGFKIHSYQQTVAKFLKPVDRPVKTVKTPERSSAPSDNSTVVLPDPFAEINPKWVIKIKENLNPSLARIVISGKWSGKVNDSRKLLTEVSEKWPIGKRVQCLITCGAFLNFDWPDDINYIKNNILPEQKILDFLFSSAEKQCKLLLDEKLRDNLLKHSDYITIGIDSYKEKISFSSAQIKKPHIELVALIDLKSNKYYWTGKSYPTKGQEDGLIRTPDISSHFFELPIGKIMVLGCHDLNVFNNRGAAATKTAWRKKVRSDFYETAKKEKPTVVLHHPHTTDTFRIWSAAWSELLNSVPSVKRYISAGRFYRDGGARGDIYKVLNNTKLGDTIDIIVNIES
jgi:hypothetical protein